MLSRKTGQRMLNKIAASLTVAALLGLGLIVGGPHHRLPPPTR